MTKQPLYSLLEAALVELKSHYPHAALDCFKINLEYPRNPEHGDFSCNIALLLAKSAGRAPRHIAQQVIQAIPTNTLIAKTEIAGPGFINLWLYPDAFQQQPLAILQAGGEYGRGALGQGQTVQIEFVSANPTGPLHVGHGRGAAYGDSLANILAAVGYQVQREYYVNDAGRQMDILATSVWLRYLELCGEPLRFPANGYRGDYVWDIAATLHRTVATQFQVASATVLANLPADTATPEELEAGIHSPAGGDKEAHIDALIAAAKHHLGEAYAKVFDLGLNTILADIRDDLQLFRIHYDEWFSEKSLSLGDNRVQATIAQLQASPYFYLRDGAWWFRSTDFGDEKDRVVIRENGQMTYFASDIAYHLHKFERGFTQVINIWGADHHGYVPRIKAALQALQQNPDRLEVLLVQFATLYRQGEQVQMSTRSGEYVTLRQLRKEVGTDAARFFYVQSKCEKHMDFDLELAKSQTSANPVYAIQYAHARICSVFKKCADRGWPHDRLHGHANRHLLTEPPVQKLLVLLSRYPDVVMNAAIQREPHQVAHYLHELASDLHRFYDTKPSLLIVTEDAALRDARLNLVAAVRQVLQNGLQLLGVAAPESM